MTKRCSRPLSSICRHGLLAVLMLTLTATGATAQNSDRIRKRDLRTARELLLSRQWEEGRALYERILDSTLAEEAEVRQEALYATALLHLALAPDQQALSSAEARLETLTAIRGHGKDLEIRALTGLFTALDETRLAAADLAEEIEAERTSCHEQLEQEGERAAQKLSVKQEALDRQREKNKAQRQRNRIQARQINSLNQRLEDSAAELAQKTADVDFVVGQLEGTQQDQQQMLDAVMRKNEELQAQERRLRAMRIALQQKESELEAQAEELSEQEAELQKREAAIREVTDRVLKKDQPDS